jgi:hypothetical protein
MLSSAEFPLLCQTARRTWFIRGTLDTYRETRLGPVTEPVPNVPSDPPTGLGNASPEMDRARQVVNVAVPMDQARTKWPILLRIVVLRPTPLRKGGGLWPPSHYFVSPIYFQHSLQTPALWQAVRTSCSLDSSRGPVRPMNRQLAYLHSRSHRAFLLCTRSLGKRVPC